MPLGDKNKRIFFLQCFFIVLREVDEQVLINFKKNILSSIICIYNCNFLLFRT